MIRIASDIDRILSQSLLDNKGLGSKQYSLKAKCIRRPVLISEIGFEFEVSGEGIADCSLTPDFKRLPVFNFDQN